jgi:RNA polymerase sigma-70 factor (ECF subfamily)
MKEVDVAREVAQDVFVRVVRALPRFRGDSAFSTWLHRITVNVCLDYLRSAYRKPAVDLVDTVPAHSVLWHLNALNCSPYEYVAASELAGSIERAATQLPTVQQRVFRMRYTTTCRWERSPES